MLLRSTLSRRERTRVFPSVHVPDVAEGGVCLPPVAYFHDLFSVAGMGREMRELQIQRPLGIVRRDDALRLAGYEVGHVLVSVLHRVIVDADPVQIVAQLPLRSIPRIYSLLSDSGFRFGIRQRRSQTARSRFGRRLRTGPVIRDAAGDAFHSGFRPLHLQ